MIAEDLSQIRDSLAKTMAGGALGLFRPEQAGEDFAAVGTRQFHREEGKQRANLRRVEAGWRPISAEPKWTKKRQGQRPHGEPAFPDGGVRRVHAALPSSSRWLVR